MVTVRIAVIHWTNWGAASRGDGDIYDEIGCDRCAEVKDEQHASYCRCADCNPLGFDIDDEDDYQEEEPSIRTCRQCGCSPNDPCIHQQYGPCWWVEDDLCSHCKHWPNESTRPNSIIF